jgi:hypothetical protein
MAKVVNRRQNEADNFLTYFVVLFYVIQCKHYTLQSNTAPLDIASNSMGTNLAFDVSHFTNLFCSMNGYVKGSKPMGYNQVSTFMFGSR